MGRVSRGSQAPITSRRAVETLRFSFENSCCTAQSVYGSDRAVVGARSAVNGSLLGWRWITPGLWAQCQVAAAARAALHEVPRTSSTFCSWQSSKDLAAQ